MITSTNGVLDRPHCLWLMLFLFTTYGPFQHNLSNQKVKRSKILMVMEELRVWHKKLFPSLLVMSEQSFKELECICTAQSFCCGFIHYVSVS